jgi:DNA polymerase-1
MKAELGAADAVVFLSDPSRNWRKEVLPTYKANRADKRPPMLRRILEAHLVEKHGAKRKPGLEADDCLGIVATNPKLYPGSDKIIVSIDKDLLTIPGKVFNWKKKDRGMTVVSQLDADRMHLFQALMGDATDGYSGCPGIGPKKAAALLDPEGKGPIDPEMSFVEWAWGQVLDTYAKAKLGPEEALVQARVARILRHSDFNYRTQEPILWTPPSP